MSARRREIDQAFRAAAWQSFLIDFKAAAWVVAFLIALFSAGIYVVYAPVLTVGEAGGVVIGVHQPASEMGRMPFRASVRLDDGRVVPVHFRQGIVPRVGERVVVRIQQRQWPPRTYMYRAAAEDEST